MKIDLNHNIGLLRWILTREQITYEFIGFGNICIRWEIGKVLAPVLLFDYRCNILKYCDRYTELEHEDQERLKKVFKEYHYKKPTWE